MDIEFLEPDDLKQAMDGSWYFIAGAGEPLEEWVTGYEEWLKDNGCGKPMKWFRTNGAAVNTFADSRAHYIRPQDRFKSDMTCLLFPLDGLDIGRLAIFKIGMQDRWFDDVIQNMRRYPEDDDE